jgi:MFS transporter, FHS family, L-fucose permease
MNNTALEKSERPKLILKKDLVPFIILSSCFLWWGLANNMTDPLVRTFTGIFKGMSTFQASMIQFAFYFAYFALAIPGAIIARKFGHKRGILTGLAFYIAGCFLLIPASLTQQFFPFLVAFYVLASGLSFLETNTSPYVLVLGPEETATQRLNLAGSFNAVGSVVGTILAQNLILSKLEALNYQTTVNAPQNLQEVREQELAIVIAPYLIVGTILVGVWIWTALTKMPYVVETDRKMHFGRLLKNKNYVFAVIAQFFYVGTQITVWTYTIFYIPDQLGLSGSEALQQYHLPALIVFGIFRFLTTAIMRRVKPDRMLTFMAVMGVLLSAVVIWAGGQIGALALVGISACMSLMFPTIFGLGSRGLAEDTKIAGSGMIMAILGGAIITPLQGLVIDHANVSISYLVPLLCFVVIAAYGIYAGKAKLPEAHVKTAVEE